LDSSFSLDFKHNIAIEDEPINKDTYQIEIDLNLKSEIIIKEDITSESNISTESTKCEDDDSSLNKNDQNSANPIKGSPVITLKETSTLKDSLKTNQMIINGKIYFSCDVCERKFDLQHKLKKHKEQHTDERPFGCNYCTMSFRLNDYLKRHVARMHNPKINKKPEKPLLKSILFDRLTGKNDLDREDAEVDPLKKGKGRIDDENSSTEALRDGITDEKPFRCNYCTMSFRLNDYLKRHVARMHNPKINKKSQFKSVNIAPLESSQRIDESNANFTCSKCNTGFSSRFKLVNHVEKRICEPRPCLICGEHFKPNYLSKHMKMAHRKDTHPVCHLCGKVCTHKSGLARHINETHLKIRNHSCTICKRTFLNGTNLKKHTLIHTGEKPFQCAVCGKRFIQHAALYSHKKSHVDHYEFECKLCDAKFKYRGLYKSHIINHTGVYPYYCSICGQGSRSKPQLQRHMTTHSRKKPFSCDDCGRTFSQKEYVRRHLQKMHIK
jgi:KRAB domain-containing zinc finger protein